MNNEGVNAAAAANPCQSCPTLCDPIDVSPLWANRDGWSLRDQDLLHSGKYGQEDIASSPLNFSQEL